MFDLQEALKNLPEHSGVYIMKNDENQIIYIGKAVSLKNRVRQYFQNSRNHSEKVKAMVSHISEFEYILTDTELEALILECNLIKKHKPKYNILLKDDKHYPYIKVTMNEEYPRIIVTRRILKDGAKYFGPYSDVSAVNETIQIVKKLFPLRSCNKSVSYGNAIDRPCLNYHIKRCMAPCQGNVEKNEYMHMIENILKLLSGKNDELIRELKLSMSEASEDFNFERAAEIRDSIISIQKVQEKQKMISTSLEDEDVIAYTKSEDGICIEVFFIRGGKLLGRESFYFEISSEDEKETLSQFIMQFYSEGFIPKTIILPEDLEEVDLIETYLTDKKGSRVYIRIPKRGEKLDLLDMARKNAEAAIEQMKYKNFREKQMTEGALEELQVMLELDFSPYRIEAYDISNIQGTDPVGSMVVFEGGKPKNKDYRRFKIKTVEGPNDYASMEEVIRRRFLRGISERENLMSQNKEPSLGKFSNFPDLVLIDGGEGQVGMAQKVFDELGIIIPVCGMVKDDRHRTRGLLYNREEVLIYKESNAFKLITRIQDEAHRFAITYHRSLRGKNSIASILNEINGIGEKRRKALLKKFNDINEIKDASVEELKSADGMNEPSAKAVFDFFHKEINNR